jgi:hypothetical protein
MVQKARCDTGGDKITSVFECIPYSCTNKSVLPESPLFLKLLVLYNKTVTFGSHVYSTIAGEGVFSLTIRIEGLVLNNILLAEAENSIQPISVEILREFYSFSKLETFFLRPFIFSPQTTIQWDNNT